MQPVARHRSRAASILVAATLSVTCISIGPASSAARVRTAHRAAHSPIVRSRCANKSRKSSCARRQARTVTRRAPVPRTPAGGAPRGGAPKGGGAGGGSSAGNGGSGSRRLREPFEEAPELSDEWLSEMAEEQAEASALPSSAPSEEAEEAHEAEESAGEEAPVQSEEEQAGEWHETPGPRTQRKYAGELPSDEGETLSDAIDPRFLTYVPFGTTSFWIQPWRSYTDTWPASRLLNAVGINFTGSSSQADAIAQLLADSGFRLARRGTYWDAMSYEHPDQLRDPSHLGAALALLKRHGLRPLVVLDADSQNPGPALHLKLETTAPAPEGASTVQLSAASAEEVVPWKTGFNGLTFGGSPDVLITAVSPSGAATLSRPLKKALPAGLHGATTLRYTPFENPVLPGGAPNPVFRETLDGWLKYVKAVSTEAASVLGPGGFDLEIWNELSFGSQYLNVEHYEAPNSNDKRAKKTINKAIRRAILTETVAFARNPANGISSAVQITDGFESESPFASGAAAPLGLNALSKHPYVGTKQYPEARRENAIVPIDAVGNRDTLKNSLTPLFVPTYQSLLPEFTILGNWSEDLLRDVAPFTSYVYGFPHGRFVAPPGGSPLQKWITEFNLAPGRGVPMAPDGVTPVAGATLTAADKAHFQAKALLRDLVAMVNKGFSRDYFFHASQHQGALNLVSPGFLAALEAHPGTYPGDEVGGETLKGFRDMLARFQGPGPSGQARQLKLLSIAQEGNHAQLAGDGTAAHPPLYDRDVLAVLPFQSSPTRFVIPVYVMTRDLLTDYEPNAPQSDVTRFDLPDESFRVTLGNLPEGGAAPAVAAYDPLRDASTPARLVSREGATATFEIAATDYPRILTLQF
jgi:hypothetical protein